MVAVAALAFLVALVAVCVGQHAAALERAESRALQEARWLSTMVQDDLVRGDRTSATRRSTHLLHDEEVVGVVVLDGTGAIFGAALSEDDPGLVPSSAWADIEGTVRSGEYVLAASPVEVGGRSAGVVVVATRPLTQALRSDVAILVFFLTLITLGAWLLSPRLIHALRAWPPAEPPPEPIVVDTGARAKAQLLANTSHELRTPLNGIVGMADVLLRTRLDDKQVEAVATIKRSSATLLALIDELLDFARIDAGKLVLEEESFDLLELVEDLAWLHAPAAQSRGLNLICRVSPAIPQRVVGDALRVRQVLTNLVGNALKFTRSGEVSIGVDIVSEDEGALELRFQVDDTGAGVPEDSLESIFESFNQGDGSTTRRFGGAGLGLAICKRLVDAMGGAIGVTSAVDRGSRFWFSVRLSRDPAAEISAVTRAVPKASILLVDGCGRSRAGLREYLDAWGLDVREASDSLAAMTQLDRTDFDLVIIDGRLPGGGAVVREARRVLTLHDIDASDANREDVLARPARRRHLRDRIVVLLSGDEASEVIAPVYEFELTAPRILVAEDNPTNQLVVGRMLESLGCEAVLVDDGDDAIEILQEEQFDLVLLDCLMPGHDGIDVARIARTRLGLTLPIIALTAHAVDGNKEACLAAGMTDFMAKPLTLDALAKVVDRWVGLPVERMAMSSK